MDGNVAAPIWNTIHYCHWWRTAVFNFLHLNFFCWNLEFANVKLVLTREKFTWKHENNVADAQLAKMEILTKIPLFKSFINNGQPWMLIFKKINLMHQNFIWFAMTRFMFICVSSIWKGNRKLYWGDTVISFCVWNSAHSAVLLSLGCQHLHGVLHTLVWIFVY